MREEESDAPNFLDFAPGTQARELARFAPEPTPSRSASVSPSPTPVESPPADLAPATGDTPRRLRRSSDWRLSTGCRVCGAPLDSLAFGCRRCGETAPRGGSDVSSGATAPLPEHPPLRRRRLALMGALACVAIGLPVTLFLEGEWRYVGIGADLLVGAMAGPFARNGLGLSAFAAAGTAGVGGKVVLGTLLGGAALSWHALQTDPLLLGLLGATLFATIILGGLLSLAAASDADEAAG